ncbi:MAG: hypothetical protein MPJ08_02620 [Nitrosopumilus sp.]|nr:hypothetical protein [Nitrosopumilus sp.]
MPSGKVIAGIAAVVIIAIIGGAAAVMYSQVTGTFDSVADDIDRMNANQQDPGALLSVAQEHPAAMAFMEMVAGYDEETVETFPGESTYTISSPDGSMVLEIDYSGPDVSGIRYTCTDANGMAQSFDTGVAEMIRSGTCQ